MPQGWWGSPSLYCLVAPAQCLGGEYLHWQQGGADTEPVSVITALLGVLEKHSAPGTKQSMKNTTMERRGHMRETGM